MKRSLVVLVFVCLLVSSCSPAATPLPLPTYTPYPTFTPPPTATATTVPTYTPYPTYTLLPTPTSVPTNTAVPPTEAPTATLVTVVSATQTPKPTQVTVVSPTQTPKPTEVTVAPRGRLAYTEYRGNAGEYDIYSVNVDGTNKKLLVANASEPSFTRDGKEVMFYDWKGNAVRIMRLDGSNNRPLILDGQAGFANMASDGYSIIYQSGEINWERWQFDLKVYIMGTDGQGKRVITEGDQPVWHPKEMYFICKTCDGSTCGLFRINADGSGRKMIVKQPNDQNAVWSPDGRRIAFASDRDGNWEVYLMDADGGNQKRLTNNPTTDALPIWLPDGQHIAFRSDRGGAWAIYLMHTDGSSVQKVVDARCSDRWRYERMAVMP